MSACHLVNKGDIFRDQLPWNSEIFCDDLAKVSVSIIHQLTKYTECRGITARKYAFFIQLRDFTQLFVHQPLKIYSQSD